MALDEQDITKKAGEIVRRVLKDIGLVTYTLPDDEIDPEVEKLIQGEG